MFTDSESLADKADYIFCMQPVSQSANCLVTVQRETKLICIRSLYVRTSNFYFFSRHIHLIFPVGFRSLIYGCIYNELQKTGRMNDVVKLKDFYS